MRTKITWFFGGVLASSLTISSLLVSIEMGKTEKDPERGSGRAPVEIQLLFAEAGQNDQAPERPPEKGNGRKDH